MGESCNDQQIYFNRYQLIKLLAKGGMGEVYEAFDPILGRKIALKRVRSDLADELHMRSRFLKERTILAGFSHPSIIPIFEVGEECGLPYYTMPLVTGSNFKEHIRMHRHCRNLANIGLLLRPFLDACHGIAYVHQTGILHRDIKAENIMLSSSRQVIIIDWGLACPLQKEERSPAVCLDSLTENNITRLGKCPGTLNYIAPERLFQQATERSDIYSLGVLFYFILTGFLPFSRKRVRDFKKRWQHEAWEDPRKIVSEFEIPDVLMRIVQKTLALDVESRYESVMGLIQDLHLFFAGIAGSPFVQEFSIDRKIDWEIMKEELSLTCFDTHLPDKLVHFFLAKKSLKTAFRLEIDLNKKEGALGFGVIFDLIDPMKDKASFSKGCFLWLSFKLGQSSTLYHQGMILFEIPGLGFSREGEYRLIIELDDYNIHFSFGEGEKKTYPKIFPSMGSRFGFVCDTQEVSIQACKIYSNDLMLRQSCLKVPDSLLRSGAHDEALEEYRRIWSALAGYNEAQEAHFKYGLVLLDRYAQRRESGFSEIESSLYQQIWSTFDSLRGNDFLLKHWIGKSFLYRISGEAAEEANCLEFAYHLLKQPEDRFVFECLCLARASQVLVEEEKVRSRFLLMIARNFPQHLFRDDFQGGFSSLRNNSCRPPFFDPFSWETIEQKELIFRQAIELSVILCNSASISVLLEKNLEDAFLTAEGIFCGLYGLLILGDLEETFQVIQKINEDILKNKFDSVSLRKILSLYTFFSRSDLENFLNVFVNDPFLLNCSSVFFHFTRLLSLFLMAFCHSPLRLVMPSFFFEVCLFRSDLLNKIFYHYLVFYKQIFIQCPDLFLRVCTIFKKANTEIPKIWIFEFSSSLFVKEEDLNSSDHVSPIIPIQDWKIDILHRYVQLFEEVQKKHIMPMKRLKCDKQLRSAHNQAERYV